VYTTKQAVEQLSKGQTMDHLWIGILIGWMIGANLPVILGTLASIALMISLGVGLKRWCRRI